MLSAYKYFSSPVEHLTTKAENKFFAGIRLPNGTFKTTASGRMTDLDAVTVQLACERGWRSPALLDVGVSSGVTTVDLLETMIANGLKPKVTATDLSVGGAIFEIAPGIRVLEDTSGDLLQSEFFGFGVRAWNRRLDFITGYFALSKLGRILAKRLPRTHLMDVKLSSRLRMASIKNALDFFENDLTEIDHNFANRFDIVRTANVLNRSYFDVSKIRMMVANLKTYVRKPGGLLIINRTHQDGTNHGTFFELCAHGVRVLRRLGGGSEIESLVCS